MSVNIPPRFYAPARGGLPSVNTAPSRGAVKAGPLGPGAGPLMTEWLLPIIMPNDEQKKAARALATGVDVPYVRMAERAISSAVGGNRLLPGVGWHLEDPDGETIDDDYAGDPRAIEAYRLLDKPFQYLDIPSPLRTRRHLWEITSRHMGLAGYGFWYLDQMDDFGIPRALLYIRPDRMLPDCDAKGALQGWRLDPKPGPLAADSGTGLSVDEVVQFQLQPPDAGYLPQGLVQSAIMKVQLAGMIDKHFAAILSGGGRLSGIISPKQGVIDDDGVYEQMVRDWRNITEQPESAKRVQIVRGPIEFTRTTATTVEMALIDFLKQNEADLLTIWGVPLSMLGGYTPTGLNSGDVRKYDRQAMWENAVIPRLGEISESAQGQILDRYEPLLGGWAPQLIIDVPSLEDDSPRFDKLTKAQFIAMTNDERRDMIGLDPMTDAGLGEQILMPNTMAPIGSLGAAPVVPLVPGASPLTPKPPAAPEPPAAAPATPTTVPAGPAPAGKAKAKGPDVTDAVVATLRKQWTPADLARVRQGEWKYVADYPLDKIDYARRPIARNPSIVQGVTAALQIGAPIDPVVLIKTKRLGGSHGKPTEPIDGWHRLLAADHAGLNKVPAYIGTGDDGWTQDLIAIDDSLPTPPDGPGTKASLRDSIIGLRQTLEDTVTQPLRASVALALDVMKRDVVSRVRTNYDHIRAKPGDVRAWWNADANDRAMDAALRPSLTDVAQTVAAHVAAVIPAPAAKATAWLGGPPAPAVVAHVLNRGAGRVTRINEATRDGLRELIAGGLEDGLSPAELGDAIDVWAGWDEYRAERIATTELMFAYNAAALETYRSSDVSYVEAVDGNDDEECAARDGQTFSVDDADEIEDHPNGTLDWIPIVDMTATEGE